MQEWSPRSNARAPLESRKNCEACPTVRMICTRQAWGRGNRTVNRAPPPGTFSAPTEPPC